MGISTLFKKGLFVFLLLIEVNAFASSPYDYFRTKQSGDWDNVNTWESSPDGGSWIAADLVPDYSAARIDILSGHKITLNKAIGDEYATVYFFSVEAGAELHILEDGELYLEGNLYVADIYGKVIVEGILQCPYDFIEFYNGSYLGVSLMNNPYLLDHINWSSDNPNGETTCEIITVDRADFLNGRTLGAKNIIYNCTNQSYDTYLSTNTTFLGDFTLLSTGHNSLKLSQGLTSNPPREIIVKGDFIMRGGELSLADAGTIRTTLKVENGFIFEQGIIKETNTAGSSILNISNINPLINIVNGSFSGRIDLLFGQDAELNLGLNEFIGSSGRVTFTGSNTIVKTAHPDGINRLGALGGNFKFTGAQIVPPAGMTVEYSGTSLQNTGTILNGNLSAVKLIVNNAQGLTYNGTGDISNTISNNLQILQGFLDIGSRSYTGTAFGGTGELRTQGTLPAGLTWTGTVNYSGGNQSIVQGQYNNLKLTGTGTKTFTGAINVSNTLDVSGTSVNVNNQPVHYNGASQNVAGLNYHELFIEGSGTKTVTAAATVKKTLTVSNSVLNANGNLTLLADASSSANVAPLLAGADIIGNLSTQIFITGGIRGNKTMSSPINDLASGNNTYSQLKKYMILTGVNGTAGGFDEVPVGAISPNTLYTYDNAQSPAFVPISNVSNQILSGKGFIYYFMGNRDYKDDNPGKLIAPYKVPENVTLTYTGIINKGNIDVPVAYNAGKTAMEGAYIAGNPYPATIDWESVYAASTNMSTTTTIVRGGGRPYATYNAEAHEGTNGGSRYLQPGQGFYVYANAGGGTLSFREGHKNVNAEPARLLNARETVKLVSTTGEVLATKNVSTANPLKKLRLQLENGAEKEEALVVFGSGFNAEFDDKDSPYNSSYSLKMATLSSDRKPTAINLMPELESIDTLRLSVSSSNSANVRLNFTDVSQVAGRMLMLRDNYLNIEQVISTDNNTYDFSIDRTISSSYGDDRLLLTFVPEVLSVHFSEVKATVKAKGTEISWTVDNQSANSKYIIERSADGITYGNLGVINAATAISTYSFIDINPLQGVNYYRIKEIDNANKQTLSKVVWATYNGVQKENVKFGIYPNPTERNVTVNTVFNTSVEVSVKQVDGRVMKRKEFTSLQMIDLDVTDLASGVYIIEVRNKELGDVLGISKFIKK